MYAAATCRKDKCPSPARIIPGGLGLIDDLPSYISAVLTVFDPGQCETIKKLLARYFDESFKAREKENLGPFLTDLKLDGEQIQVFLDLLNILTVCEERDWMKYFVK